MKMMITKIIMKLKKNFLTVLILLTISFSYSQDLAGGIEEATDELQTVFTSIKAFLFVLAAIVGVYGGFNVYSKYQSQDQDAAKAAAKYGFGFIFLMASAFIVEAVFIN